MNAPPRIVITCSCEKTQPLDEVALVRGCGGKLQLADQMCRGELDKVRAALASGAAVTASCTQEAPLFTELAEELGAADRLTTVNIRENGGWSRTARDAGPKMAALLAAAAEPAPSVSLVPFESQGVALIYGRDDVAIEAAQRLADHLNVTVLLSQPGDVAPPRTNAVPVFQGTIVGATGHLGAFELRVDDYAVPAPSSRQKLAFGPGRNGAKSRCDLIIDLSGGAPMFSAPDLRSGYLRADPGDPLAVERALHTASHMVGEFDKPRFVQVLDELCAHSRSRITGCTRCLGVCPTGAISPAGDHIAIDPYICAGCGSCGSVCPTGAASYALPPADALIRKLRTLMRAYREAGGEDATILFHDGDHGEPLIGALARHGEGLPARVIPVRVNEVTQVGPEAIAALFAFGAVGVRFLTRAQPKHDVFALRHALEIAGAIATGLGYASPAGTPVVSIIATDDPDELGSMLAQDAPGTPTPIPADFVPQGNKRDVLVGAMRALRLAAPAPVDRIPLATGAPFGTLDVNVDGCTLCLSCVTACPSGALKDGGDQRPALLFSEDLCVQCGLCANTCPEKVIRLQPQIDFAAWNAPPRVIKEEEPFPCIACGKPFGTRSSIERVIAKLQDKHWMFSGPAGESRINNLRMCEDCRVRSIVDTGFDPHGAPERAAPRTTDDYLRARNLREVEGAEN